MDNYKVCPIMLSGLFANSKVSYEKLEKAITEEDSEGYPWCLKKKCALWVNPPYNFGHCGLRKAILNGED